MTFRRDNLGSCLKCTMGLKYPRFSQSCLLEGGPMRPRQSSGLTQIPLYPWSLWGCIRPRICSEQGWAGLWFWATQGERTATVRAPREPGVTEPQKPCVCVWNTPLLSPACTDATLFLFQIFTADFLFTLASAPASPVVVFWCSCSFQCRLDRVARQQTTPKELLVWMQLNVRGETFIYF